MGPPGCNHGIVTQDHMLLPLEFMNVKCLGNSKQ